MKILVTGGAGFIGSNFILHMMNSHPDIEVLNLDVLTYAGNLDNLKGVDKNPLYTFIRGDICDPEIVNAILDRHKIDVIVHFAAESHVDRSITKASEFVRTNVLGTHNLLECTRHRPIDRFIHISTDEVYGSIMKGSFKERDTLSPSSPYSASKAGSDLLALSYFTTYKLPVIITRCTNNFGPYQYPEKLIPLFVTNLIAGKKVPVYGTGKNIRDWIHVNDHCRAIEFLLKKGIFGEIYNIGGGNEKTNIEITERILRLLKKDESFIEHVADRPGHDFRYSLDCSKLLKLGWSPRYSFEEGLKDTVEWYLRNEWWWKPLQK
jgi:dTDP-glucose 4,6-dehydratase